MPASEAKPVGSAPSGDDAASMASGLTFTGPGRAGMVTLRAIIARIVAVGRDADAGAALDRNLRVARECQEQLVTGVRNNFILEADVTELEHKIELLVKNRMAVEDDSARHRGKAAAPAGGRRARPAFSSDVLKRYGKLLHLLKWRPQYLAALSTLIRPSATSHVDEMAGFAAFVVTSLFANLQSPREERYLLLLFRLALQGQFKAHRDNVGGFMRASTPLTHMLALYTKRLPAVLALRAILGPFVSSVVMQDDLRLEIDPVLVYRELLGDDDPGSAVALEEAAADPHVAHVVAERVRVLSSLCEELVTRLLDAIPQFSDGIRQLCHLFRVLGEQTFPDLEQHERDALVGGFVILRFISPALMLPDAPALGIVPGPTSKTARRNLTLIAKVLQTLANGTTFGDKEAFMAPMNAFLAHNRKRMALFFGRLTAVSPVEEELEVDRYLEHVQTQEPIIYLHYNQLVHLHVSLLEHLPVLERTEKAIGEGKHLRGLLAALPHPGMAVHRDSDSMLTVPLSDPDATVGVDVSQRLIRRTSSKRTIAQFVAAETKDGRAPPDCLPPPSVPATARPAWVAMRDSMLALLRVGVARNPSLELDPSVQEDAELVRRGVTGAELDTARHRLLVQLMESQRETAAALGDAELAMLASRALGALEALAKGVDPVAAHARAASCIVGVAKLMRHIERTRGRVELLENAVDALDEHTRYLLSKRNDYELYLDSARAHFAPKVAIDTKKPRKAKLWTWKAEEAALEKRKVTGDDRHDAAGASRESRASSGVHTTRAQIEFVRVGGLYRSTPFGFRLQRAEAGCVVSGVMEDSPAATIGVACGDVVQSVAGADVSGMRYDDVMAHVQAASAALSAGGPAPRIVFRRPAAPAVVPSSGGPAGGAGGGGTASDMSRRRPSRSITSMSRDSTTSVGSDGSMGSGSEVVALRDVTFTLSHSALHRAHVIVKSKLPASLQERVKVKFQLLNPEHTVVHDGCGTFRLRAGVQGMAAFDTTVNLEELLEQQSSGVEEVVVGSITFNVAGLVRLLNSKLAGM